MFDLTHPIGNEIIIGSIVFILLVVVVGLLVVEHYKKRQNSLEIKDKKCMK